MLFAANGKRERENGENTSGKESPSGKAAGIRRGKGCLHGMRFAEKEDNLWLMCLYPKI